MLDFAVQTMHEVYSHDDLDRVTAAIRDSSLAASTPGKGSQTWAMDTLGNWLDSYTASSDSSGLDSRRSQEFNATNEIAAADTSPDLPGGEKTIEYDAAGNLVSEQLADSGGLQRRRVLRYDAWNRLTRITIQTRADSGSPWANDQTLVAYSYYADNRLATRVADAVADGQARPTERTHYFYDGQWNLLEEHVDGGYDATPSGPIAPWSWSDSGFASAFSAARRLVRQYIWDPTAQDELIQVRRTTTPGSTEFTQSDWILTDRNRSVIGMIPSGASGAPTSASTDSGARTRYTAYGRPTLQARGDADHSDATDFNDYNAILGAWNKPIGHADYAASVDLDHSGLIDFNDISALLATWGSTAVPGASAPALRPCSIAYTGALWDPVAQMSLMRNRWQDPSLGRFITRDPAGYVDGMSLYLYSRGNPLGWWDPWGLFCRRVEHRNERYEVDDNGTVWRVEDVFQSGWFGFGEMTATGATRRQQMEFLDPSDVASDGTLRQDNDSGGAMNNATESRNANKDMVNEGGNQLSEEAGSTVIGAAAAPIAGKVAGKVAGAAVDAVEEGGVRMVNKGLAGKQHPKTGVPFDEHGFADFSSHAKSTVTIKQTGNRATDAAAANRAAGLERTPDGYVWHHHQDGRTMQLVPEQVHQQTGHTGGVATQRRKPRRRKCSTRSASQAVRSRQSILRRSRKLSARSWGVTTRDSCWSTTVGCLGPIILQSLGCRTIHTFMCDASLAFIKSSNATTSILPSKYSETELVIMPFRSLARTAARISCCIQAVNRPARYGFGIKLLLGESDRRMFGSIKQAARFVSSLTRSRSSHQRSR
jgi:RHS repeat-associated protein